MIRAFWNLWYRLRTWHGFLRLHWLLFERKWGVIALGMAAAVYGLYREVPCRFQNREVDILAVLLLLFSAGFLWRDFRELSHALAGVHSLDFDISQIRIPTPGRFVLPESYTDDGNFTAEDRKYVPLLHPQGAAIFSKDVNDILRGKAGSIRLREGSTFDVFDKRCECVPSWVRDAAPYILRQAFRGTQILFNSKKVRLGTDLLPPSLQEETPTLVVQRTDYFSSLCTNETALRRVFRRDVPDPPILEEFRFLYPAEKQPARPGVLATLRDSPCANHVGVSTIGVTEDGHLVWTVQSGSSAQSAGRIAPTGSGSADYADLREGESLLDFLTRAMERELRQECGIAGKIPVRTEIVGFARLLHRGGKPEFFGFSRIGGGRSCLGIPPSETPFQSRISHARPAGEAGSPAAHNIQEEIRALRQNLGGAFSFLMHLNLMFLEEHLQTTRS